MANLTRDIPVRWREVPTPLSNQENRLGIRALPLGRGLCEDCCHTPSLSFLPYKMVEEGARSLSSCPPPCAEPWPPPRPLPSTLWRRPRLVSSTPSRGPAPPGVVPARKGGHTAVPGHAEAAEHHGSRALGSADPPSSGHGPPVSPSAWELLWHAAAQGGELLCVCVCVFSSNGQCIGFTEELCEIFPLSVCKPLLKTFS